MKIDDNQVKEVVKDYERFLLVCRKHG